MAFDNSSSFRIAVNDGTGFYLFSEGADILERETKPELLTVRYLGAAASETEILGVTELVRFRIAYNSQNPAHTAVFALRGLTGENAVCSVFIYNESDYDSVTGLYSGRLYSAAVSVTASGHDDGFKTPFYIISGVFYLNGDGIAAARSVTE